MNFEDGKPRTNMHNINNNNKNKIEEWPLLPRILILLGLGKE